ncbi:MAG: Gfo/Idh/MocA family oxidoreductase [Phycisphaerales bacterium]|jgi:predicted dehydrogenase|nr:Gfo/Idh/MocA family oxidoreductase [Phycisphaerales bacterium]
MTQYGLLGAGMIANVHAEAIVATGGEIVSVYDPRDHRREEFSKKWSCDSCSDFASLLSKKDIDAVVVAAPNDRHAELAIAAMQCGKDVLLEKPMAMSIAQCNEIIQVQHETNRVLQLGFVCRFSPAVRVVREMIEEGKLGTVYNARATLLRQRGIPGLGSWFTNKERSGGGCLIDIGVHLIDLLSYITSATSPSRVVGSCTQTFSLTNYGYEEMWATPNPEGTFDVEDGVRAMTTFEDGSTHQIDVSWATHLPERSLRDGVSIEGDQGAVWFDVWGNAISFGSSEEGKPVEKTIAVEVQDAWSEAFQAEHNAFASSLLHRSISHGAGAANDGLLVQTIVDAIYQSSCEQREVAVTPL